MLMYVKMHQNQNTFKNSEINHPTHEQHIRSSERSGEHDFGARVSKLSNTVGRSEYYGRLRSQGATHAEAFSEAAHILATQKQAAQNSEALSSPDKALIDVIGQLGIFIEAKQEHDAIAYGGDSRYLGRDDKDQLRSLKEAHLIPFNHSVKELINTHPEANMRDVATNLTRAHAALFSKHSNLHPSQRKHPEDIVQPKDVAYTLEAVINGMRHEVAGEALIDAAGYTFDHDVSVAQDRRGNDGFITTELNGRTIQIPIDFKASAAAAEKSQQEHSYSKAVWTGLAWEDFTGRKGHNPGALSVPYATIQKNADAFMDRVFKVYARNTAQRSATRQRTAQAALVS